MPQPFHLPDRKYIEASSENRAVWESPFTPEMLKIWQLENQLRQERCLNELSHRLSTCVSRCLDNGCPLDQSPPIEAEVFQILVQELSRGLADRGVAIALSDPTDPGTPRFIVHHLSSCSPLPQESASLLPPDAPGIQLRPGQTLTRRELRYLKRQPTVILWQFKPSQAEQGWLIVYPLVPHSRCDRSTLDQHALLIERAMEQMVNTLQQVQRIRQQQQQQQELVDLNRELLQASQYKSEFLANTSHEIRTPLSSILGFTHLLRERSYNPLNPRHQDYLNVILASGQHLLALINDILDLSKIEANQLDLQWDAVSVQEVCQTALTLVREKASEKGLVLHFDRQTETDQILADGLRLKQMLFNLLSNAIKFTLQGTVGLRVTQQDDRICFTVWDTGVGISAEQQLRLFRPYAQIPNAAVERGEGTGLGLALTQKLAELHGGRVEVTSEQNQGSRFTIVLPLHMPAGLEICAPASDCAIAPAIPPVDAPRPDPPASVAGPQPCEADGQAIVLPFPDYGCNRLLLVEDNPNNARLVLTCLSKRGYEVTWAKNGRELWRALERSLPSLILMDIQLPEVDGLSLIHQLQADSRYAAIPIIAQTAMAMKGDRDICLNAGAVEYLAKPIDLNALTDCVARCINARTGLSADL